jgi:intein/homing endonuclease
MISSQYAAGFFDGEGCINVSSCRKTILIRTLVVNTNLTILEMFKEKWGGDIYSNKKGKEHWKQAYTWRLSNNAACEFLKDIYPFLVVKVQQAEASFIFFDNRPGKGKQRTEEAEQITKEAIDKIKSLNKKGVL